MKQSEQSHVPSFGARQPSGLTLDVVLRGLSLALSIALIAVLVFFPGVTMRGDDLLRRAVLPVLLIGIAGALAYGLGYKPRSSLLAAMLGPWVSWPLMLSAMAFLVLSTDN
ncbi:hypothetical protein sos41_11110 [Alphaproteobacteria bacterium SO-S41]|nr:hypothetical protein sos41_11110 [Alphaproteobacteria bacterium SO-S41]